MLGGGDDLLPVYTDCMTTIGPHGGDGTVPRPGNVRLRAIVAVDSQHRVQCQQPGCGHSVYAAIHVVEEEGHLLVLGSTCFAQRYGSASALGPAQYGGAGGQKLTDEERQLLIQNTVALLARFEAQAVADAEAVALAKTKAEANELLQKQQMVEKLQRPRALSAVPQSAIPGLAQPSRSPWPWQMEQTSVALFTAPDGAHWLRVQHKDGSQKLVPWPQFDGWEFAFPPGFGRVDSSIGAIAVDNIVEAIKAMRSMGFPGPKIGRWQDVLPRRHVPVPGSR